MAFTQKMAKVEQNTIYQVRKNIFTDFLKQQLIKSTIKTI
jgi:hypothetical protein